MSSWRSATRPWGCTSLTPSAASAQSATSWRLLHWCFPAALQCWATCQSPTSEVCQVVCRPRLASSSETQSGLAGYQAVVAVGPGGRAPWTASIAAPAGQDAVPGSAGAELTPARAGSGGVRGQLAQPVRRPATRRPAPASTAAQSAQTGGPGPVTDADSAEEAADNETLNRRIAHLNATRGWPCQQPGAIYVEYVDGEIRTGTATDETPQVTDGALSRPAWRSGAVKISSPAGDRRCPHLRPGNR